MIWHDSYAAEQHVHHYGKSDVPVCWSLAGYASGYVSACLGQEIYFRESECLAQGAPKCSVIGKDAASWGDALEALRFDFQSADLGRRSNASAKLFTSVCRNSIAASGTSPSVSAS